MKKTTNTLNLRVEVADLALAYANANLAYRAARIEAIEIRRAAESGGEAEQRAARNIRDDLAALCATKEAALADLDDAIVAAAALGVSTLNS